MKRYALLIAGLVIASYSFGGITGKIQGRVTDRLTGEPLPFANVVIEGTTMGAATNIEGEYFIINVRPGTYILSVRMMGYVAMRVENVRVSADLTTGIDFPLEPTVIEGEEIVVTAERPIIERDATSSIRRVEARDIERMPVTDFQDVVAQQAGVVETGGRWSGGLHIRGGRDGEVAYIVDGISVNDPVTNAPGIFIDKSAIQEMQILAGGFNAEFGEAMSGVVNIITKEGGERHTGGISFRTDAVPGGEKYDFGYRDIEFTLGGPIPLFKNATFFVSGTHEHQDDRRPSIALLHQPHNEEGKSAATAKLVWRPIVPLSVRLSGNWSQREFHVYSHVRSRGNWLKDGPLVRRGNYQTNLSLTHTVSPSTFYNINIGVFNTFTKYSAQKGAHYHDFRAVGPRLDWVKAAMDSGFVWTGEKWVSLYDGYYDQEMDEWHDITPDEAWRLYYVHLGQLDPDGYAHDPASWEHIEFMRIAWNRKYYDTGSWEFNEDSTDIYYLAFDLDAYLYDVKTSPDRRSDIYRGDIDQWVWPRPRDEFGHFVYNFFARWHERNTTHYTADFSLTSQVNRFNQIKLGAMMRRSDLRLTDIQFSNPRPYSDSYHKRPVTAAAYVQNKIEHEDMTINCGVRFDYFNPVSDHFIDMENLDAGMKRVRPKYQFSPRFGISFAMTDKALMYASYGHFFQPIELGELYQALNADLHTGLPLLGDPDMAPQKTIAYEAGFRYAFTPDMGLDMTAYYKDITNLLATRKVHTLLQEMPVSYTLLQVMDIAVVKGIDVVLHRRRGPVTGSISYSYLDAKGTGSSGREFYYVYRDHEGVMPQKMYPLEFDVTHSFKAGLNLYLPRGTGPSLFGVKLLSDVNANLQFTAASGRPYIPVDDKGQPLKVGARRLPGTQQTDLRVDRGFRIGGLNLGLYIDVRNLFNQENIRDVYALTGEPDDNGRPPKRETYGERWDEAMENWRRLVKNPRNYGIPRMIRTGIEISF